MCGFNYTVLLLLGGELMYKSQSFGGCITNEARTLEGLKADKAEQTECIERL